ncbi:MAG: YwqG family protein [Eubacteriales bacterium]
MCLTDKIKSLSRNSVELTIAGACQNPAGTTHFGGLPDVPADFMWPHFETATYEDPQVSLRPLAFLCQFDCAELAAYDSDSLLPKSGILSFFYEYASQRWGFDPDDRGCARVFYFPDRSLCRPAALPENLPDFCRFPCMTIGMKAKVSYPEYDDFRMLVRDSDDDEFDRICGEMNIEPPDNCSKLLGWANLLQSNITEECELTAHGYYLGDHTSWEQIPAEIRQDAEENSPKEWLLLLQLDRVEGDDGFDLMFGDCGRLYFYIRKVDLAAGRFDRIGFALQCG